MYAVPYKNDLLMNGQQFINLIEEIKKATQKEEEYVLFYNYLLTVAPNDEEAKIIQTIREESRRHYEIFNKMYKDLTGMEIPLKSEFISPESYLDGLKRAFFMETGAVDDYKEIRISLPPISFYRDVLLSIIIDELNHANKFNYLFTVNGIKASTLTKKTEQDRFSFSLDNWTEAITQVINSVVKEQENNNID